MQFLSRGISAIVAVLMVALIALVTVQVVLRYFFGSPLQWSLEISRILFIWIVFLGAAIAVRRKQYTALDVLSRRFPSWWNDRLIVVVMILFALLLAGLGSWYLRNSDEGRFTMTGLPVIIVYVAPAVSGVLIFLFSLERLLARRSKSDFGERSSTSIRDPGT